MSTIHAEKEKKLIYTKGAPEVLLAKATHIFHNGAVSLLTEDERKKIIKVNESMASRALRVLAAAYRFLPDGVKEYDPDSAEKNLIFVGLMGMIDPPREEVKLAMRECKAAGIRPVMVTGDHKLTALAIAGELGQLKVDLARMTPEQEKKYAVTGAELDKMSDRDLAQRVRDLMVYARVSPEHKMRIVNAWQDRKQVVAMTGDGVNDAPALKKADIGVAMGVTGTDVTKEASDMVLVDDNFATIVKAVKEGRGIFENIKKYLIFLLSCNVAEILICFVSALFNWPVPLIPIHLLWVNLTTDGLPALALGVDPADPDLMQRPPRSPKDGIFTRQAVGLIGGIGFWITLLVLSIFWWYWQYGGPFTLEGIALQAEAYGLDGKEFILEKARTMCLMVLILLELFNAYNCRHHYHSLFKIGFFSNKWLTLANLSSLFLAIAVIYLPGLNRAFRLVPMTIIDWGVAALASISVIVFVEIIKVFMRAGKEEKIKITRVSEMPIRKTV
jgi:Ca2+-transporting ATPase